MLDSYIKLSIFLYYFSNFSDFHIFNLPSWRFFQLHLLWSLLKFYITFMPYFKFPNVLSCSLIFPFCFSYTPVFILECLLLTFWGCYFCLSFLQLPLLSVFSGSFFPLPICFAIWLKCLMILTGRNYLYLRAN